MAPHEARNRIEREENFICENKTPRGGLYLSPINEVIQGKGVAGRQLFAGTDFLSGRMRSDLIFDYFRLCLFS